LGQVGVGAGAGQVMVTRSFLVEDQAYEVAGLSDQDPYLSSIHGRFEPKFQRFCSMLPPDAVAMDIGANIGVTSIILGHYLPQGRVFALEPGKTIFGLLERNLKHSGRQNVTPLNCAVSDQTQVLRFVEQSAYGHLDANAAACSPEDEGAVKTYALDDLVDELKLDRLDFIKVDVEGFEPEFFEGARRTLARFNPVVYFELNSWCLIDHGGHNPIEFMTKIVGDFRFVYRVNNNTDSDTVLDKVVSSHLAQALVHANIALHGSIDDIVVVNDESRLDRALFSPHSDQSDPEGGVHTALLRQVKAVQAERDQLKQKLEQLRCELNLILNSRSWRFTRFLRRDGPEA
jgi:FkbM family methyltransferase